MRFDALLFPAYGSFTDVRLDVSPGDAGLHLIYGPNEAGKSTSLSGIRAFFEGFPHRTTADFQHDQGDLRVGAVLRAGGRSRTLLRRKGRKDTLLDAEGKPAPEADLLRLMGGLEPALYTGRFVLGYDELVRGGADLLADHGEVGRSLFAAGLGGGRLRALLKAFEGEADELFRPRGQKQALNQALKDYKDARAAVRDRHLKGREYAEKSEERARIEASLNELDRRLGELAAQRERLERQRRSLPRVARYEALKGELDALGPLPPLRRALPEERRAAQDTLHRQGEIARLAEERRADLTARRAALTLNRALLDHREAIDALKEQRGSVRKAWIDRQRHLGTRNEKGDERAQKVARLPGALAEGGAALRLDALAKGRIDELRERRQALSQAREERAREAEEAAQGRARAEARLAALGETPDPAPLTAAVRRIRAGGDPDALLRAATARVDAELAALTAAHGRLRPAVALASLATLPIPSEATLRRFEWELRAKGDDVRASAEALDRLRGELDGVKERLAAMERAGSVPTEDALRDARAKRDRRWQAIRAAWVDGAALVDDGGDASPPGETADAFRAEVDDADQLADRLRLDASRVSRFADLLAQAARLSHQIGEAEGRLQAARAGADAADAAWVGAWAEAGISPSTPGEMLAWHAEVSRLRARQEAAAGAEAERDGELARQAERRASLAALLIEAGGAVDEADGLAALLDKAEARAEALAAARRARQDAAERLNDAAHAEAARRTAAEAAEAAWDRWQEAWAQALAPLALDAATPPRLVAELLQILQEIDQLDREILSTTRRIDSIERDQRAFEEAVGHLMGALDLPPDPLGAEAAVDTLHHALRGALEQEATARQLDDALAQEAARLGQATERIRLARASLDALCEEAGVDDPAALPELEARVEHGRRLAAALADLEADLLADGGGAPLAALIEAARGCDAEVLTSDLARLGESLKSMEEERGGLFVHLGALQETLAAMGGSAGAAEAAEDAQAHAARIVSLTDRFAQLNLATLVLRREMEAYRRAHEGPILERAREHFAAFTLGSFEGLETDWDEADRPILKGRRPGRQRVGVEGMSDGTRDQLYLALRLASIESQVARAEPLPLIVDDILITADDDRARAILTALADLSHRTQVLFFTHHRHLVSIARALGRADVFVHPSL